MNTLRNLSEHYLKELKKLSKQELIQRIDWKEGTINRQNNVNEISGVYKINVYKNKSLVHSISMGWKDNPHGARFNDVKDLASSLMTAYQDYESLIETEIIIKDDWDELPNN